MSVKKELPPAAFLVLMLQDPAMPFGVIQIDDGPKRKVEHLHWYKFPLGKHIIKIYVSYDEDPWFYEVEAKDTSLLNLRIPSYKTLDQNLTPEFYHRNFLDELDVTTFEDVVLNEGPGKSQALIDEAKQIITDGYMYSVEMPFFHEPKKKQPKPEKKKNTDDKQSEASDTSRGTNGEKKKFKLSRKALGWLMILGGIALLFICGPIAQMSNFETIQGFLGIVIIAGIGLLIVPPIAKKIKNKSNKKSDK